MSKRWVAEPFSLFKLISAQSISWALVTGLGGFNAVKKHLVIALDLPSLIQAKRTTGPGKDLSALAEL
jgi:hypothetical protein